MCVSRGNGHTPSSEANVPMNGTEKGGKQA